MDALIRSIAILIELSVLGALFYHVLKGVRITLFDLGMKPEYSNIVTLALIAVGGLVGVFLVSHLFAFYPAI